MIRYTPYFDGKRWHVDNPTTGERISPEGGFKDFAAAMRWIQTQKTGELL